MQFILQFTHNAGFVNEVANFFVGQMVTVGQIVTQCKVRLL